MQSQSFFWRTGNIVLISHGFSGKSEAADFADLTTKCTNVHKKDKGLTTEDAEDAEVKELMDSRIVDFTGF